MKIEGNGDQRKYIPLEGKTVSLKRGYLFPQENLSVSRCLLFSQYLPNRIAGCAVCQGMPAHLSIIHPGHSRETLRCSNFANRERSKETKREEKTNTQKTRIPRVPLSSLHREAMAELHRDPTMYRIGHRVRVCIGLATALSWSHGRGPFNSTRTRRTVSRKVWFSVPWLDGSMPPRDQQVPREIHVREAAIVLTAHR